MKLRFKPSPYFEFEIEGTTQKDFFQAIADIGEIFTDEPCGVCKSTDTRYRVRNVDSNNFFEKVCNKCFARLAFGQHKKTPGSLFPKRKFEDGSYDVKNQGWSKWIPPEDDEEEEEPTPKKKKK